MDDFSSSGEFGQVPKHNQIMEELQNDTTTKENQMVDLGKSDLGSVNNLMHEPIQSGSAILEGMDVDIRLGHGLGNQGGGASGICEQAGLNEYDVLKVSLEGADVSLKCIQVPENIGEGAYVSADIPTDKPVHDSNVISDNVFSEGVDASSRFEHGSENQEKGALVSGICEQAGFDENGDLKIAQINDVISDVNSEGVDVSLKYESEKCNLAESNENSELKHDLERVGVSLKSEHMSEYEGAGAHVTMICEQPISKENMDLEAQQGNAKLDHNEVSKDDTIDSSMMEQVENLQSDIVKPLTPPPLEKPDENLLVVVLGVPAGCEKPRRGRKPKGLVKKESSQQLSVASTRALRSRAKENREEAEPSADIATTKERIERRGRKKGQVAVGKSNDEFSKMRKHLQYLLHRIKYEQNLLDAYSSEGWRGQSMEKLRPEKELQRAKADINRSKLKIRDLFKKLDSMSTEGKFPESLYDSDGLIDSEDIFCAKCGSKDLYSGNDILLCDGICDRGFHQNCLNPPLPTEKIPPGDEGWLCPACDCKVDCYNLLNDSHGTKLAIEDNWEKVFPEALAAKAGNELDDIMGLPSDDSEDNEYNPDGPNDDASVEGNESCSDESGSNGSDSSDFSSASEDLGAIGGPEQNLGLPSDDSEDDDFDPDAPNVNEDGAELESSGSDFTSASEDLGATVGATSDQGEPPLPLELEQELGESSIITGKRCSEKLDYKKLYDETFGNAAPDSSDDEEWTDTAPTRKRKNSTEKISCASASTDGACGSGGPRKRGRPKANHQVANGSPAQLQESSQKTNTAGSSQRRPPYNKLGEAVTKRLYESFKENQYPDRETKEKLANEVGLTFHRVDKWFVNARWSLYHHPSRIEASMNRAISSSSTPHSVACNGGETTIIDNSADTRAKKLTPRRSKTITKDSESILENSIKNSKEEIQGDALQASEITQSEEQRKRRKSGE